MAYLQFAPRMAWTSPLLSVLLLAVLGAELTAGIDDHNLLELNAQGLGIDDVLVPVRIGADGADGNGLPASIDEQLIPTVLVEVAADHTAFE